MTTIKKMGIAKSSPHPKEAYQVVKEPKPKKKGKKDVKGTDEKNDE